MSHFSRRSLRWVALLLLTPAVVLLTGCATTSSSITQVSADTYMVTLKEKRSYFDMNESKSKEQAIVEAMNFAEGKGKVVVAGNLQEDTRGVFGDFVKIEYTFKLVDKSDPRAKRGSTNDAEKQPDVYDQLAKLDDLRKRGVLTPAEFEREKQKLLSH
jgi:hypothetical protein